MVRVYKKRLLRQLLHLHEYRPSPETVNQKHADMCFSRTGVCRVGTDQQLYDACRRGFLQVINKTNAFRVLPARYYAYIAIHLTGNKEIFGPMRFDLPDGKNRDIKFWVPIHKLFNGQECIRNFLHLTHAFHVNEKIKRIHLHMRNKINGYPKKDDKTLGKPPYTFTTGITEFSTISSWNRSSYSHSS